MVEAEEFQETIRQLKDQINSTYGQLLAMEKKCESQSKEIVRLNLWKLESNINYTPSISSGVSQMEVGKWY
jgi:hypothetical protein